MGKRNAEEEVETDTKKSKNEESSGSDEPCAAEQRTSYIGGIPYNKTEADIKSWFEEWCGKVDCIEMMTWPNTDDFRGIALVTFATWAGAQESLGCHHSEWDGNYLVVKQYESSKRTDRKEKFRSLNKTEEEQKADDDAAQVGADGDNNTNSNSKPAIEVPEEGPFLAYVGNLAWDVDEDSLREFLETNLSRRTRIVSMRMCETEKAKFCFVEFTTASFLRQAIQALDQKSFWDRPIKCMVAAPPRKREEKEKPVKGESDGKSVMVRQLPEGTATNDTLEKLFVGHKPINIYVPRGMTSYGFVTFATPKEAENALIIDGAKINGQSIKVQIAREALLPNEKKMKAKGMGKGKGKGKGGKGKGKGKATA